MTKRDETVLITGASSGIGAATAEQLAPHGFRVFGTSRRERESKGDGIEWVAMDIRDEGSVERAVARVIETAGQIDAVVCNAGMGIFGSAEEVPISAAQEQFDTNYFGTLRTLRAVLPGMRSARHGRVIIVGSLGAHAPIPFQSHYSSSKAAVAALALALRNEVHRDGIHVSLIEPGDCNTPFNDATEWGDPAGSSYGDRIAGCRAAIVEMLPKAPEPSCVASVIERALTARRPRVRYSAAADAWLAPFARRFLPDWLTLAMIRSRYRV
jgi:NAD(P)-dependent dehydrogenase (short-subunit alcohol dehydrogenase family)